MISEELRESYRLAAEACRYAAEQGWRPTDAWLVADHHSPTEWSCCALGALALKREVSAYDLPLDPASFAKTLEFVADLPLSMAFGGHGDPLAVAHVFDGIVNAWSWVRAGQRCRSDEYTNILRDLDQTHESMAKLTPTEVWLLAASRFEQLAN